MADATYVEPVEWRTVSRIIERERPDALLPTMGGQTALNCALDLVSEGVLEKFGVQMIGASQAVSRLNNSCMTIRQARRPVESGRSQYSMSFLISK